MEVEVHVLSAFSKNSEGGNQAGIVLSADQLTNIQMQWIAEKVGFSETAFVLNSNLADFRIRFFTPNEEVDLCGHATIASFFLLHQEKFIKVGACSIETQAGILEVEIMEDGSIYLQQTPPKYYGLVPKREIAESLNLSLGALVEELPVEIVSTGLKDIIVPLKKLDCLLAVNPDLDKIAEISRKYHVIGYHVFSLETLQSSTAHCRNFAPLYDIPEESATGTSNGALSAYLYKNGKLEKGYKYSLVFEQGYSMNKPSEIKVQMTATEESIKKIVVGGTAVYQELYSIKL